MCDECKMICIYVIEDCGESCVKLFVHYDKDNRPIWIEYVKNDDSLGEYHKKK
jgi:hypothetical protein